MPRKNNILIRSGTAAPTAADFNVGEPAWDKTNKKFYVKAADGTMVDITGSGGSSGVVAAASASSFPATGADNTLYVDKSTNRIYRWDGAVYAEVGSLDSDSSNWTLLVPGTPTGVSGTAGNAQVILSWTAPTYTAAAITDYSIQYSSNSGSSWTTWSHTASTATTQTVTGLTNNTAYIFRVAAVSGIGTGSYSANSASITPVTDQYYSSVSLLLKFDGTSGATTFTDSSPSPKSITSVSGAQLSSTQSKFGGTSLYLNGTGYVTIPYSADLDLGASDWTIEWWQYWTGGNSIFCWSSDFRYGILANYAGATSDKLALCLSSTGSSWNMAQPDTVNSTFAGSSTGGTKNAWQHIAIQRSGTTFQMFFDGTRVLNYTASGTLYSPTGNTFRLGGPWPGAGPGNFTGYIDEFRFTKSVARYSTTGNFTAPTTAFPTS